MRSALRASKKFERQVGVQNHRVELIARGDVATSIDQFKLRIHGFGGADSIGADGVLEGPQVCWTTYGIIRFPRVTISANA